MYYLRTYEIKYHLIRFSVTVIRYDSVCDDCYLIDCRTDKTKEWMN